MIAVNTKDGSLQGSTTFEPRTPSSTIGYNDSVRPWALSIWQWSWISPANLNPTESLKTKICEIGSIQFLPRPSARFPSQLPCLMQLSWHGSLTRDGIAWGTRQRGFEWRYAADHTACSGRSPSTQCEHGSPCPVGVQGPKPCNGGLFSVQYGPLCWLTSLMRACVYLCNDEISVPAHKVNFPANCFPPKQHVYVWSWKFYIYSLNFID